MRNYISGYINGEEFCDYFKNKKEFYKHINSYMNRCYYFTISGSKWTISIQTDDYTFSLIPEIKGKPPKYIIEFLEYHKL